MTPPAQSDSTFSSHDPATGEVVWTGVAAGDGAITAAVEAARRAFRDWSLRPFDDRCAIATAFAGELTTRRADLARAISREVGKPTWESLTEVDAMIAKVPLSIRAAVERRGPVESESGGVISATRFRPHGVVAVLGPFNFPGHLPNGHIVPALLAGNVVVFKPSEFAPSVADLTERAWHAAGLPADVLQVPHGTGSVGARLAELVDGVFFTGSSRVGRALLRANVDRPSKVLALEMGGNNPLVVHDVQDVAAAVHLTIQSAYITAGQRCTCARRLIVPAGNDRFIESLVDAVRAIHVGPFTDSPEPFMGPVIHRRAADGLIDSQTDLVRRGGKSLVGMRRLGPAMLSPGLIDVSNVVDRADEELFGPLLQLIRVPDFDAAIDEANRTRYGLAAGLVCDRPDLYRRFFESVRAGVVNWNRPTTGASGSMPFGGVGDSGNHRPSGYFAADYCSYAVASIESPRLVLPPQLNPGMSAAFPRTPPTSA